MSLTAIEINAIYAAHRVPHKIIKHMLKVAKLAGKLCDKFIKKGYKIDKDLVVNSALLHDIARVVDFKNLNLKNLKQGVRAEDLNTWISLNEQYKEKDHAEAAEEILKKLGHKRIATVVGKHHFRRIDDLKTWEEKLVYYADKRVRGSSIVSLRRKLKKHDNQSPKTLKIIEKIYELEKEISSALKR